MLLGTQPAIAGTSTLKDAPSAGIALLSQASSVELTRSGEILHAVNFQLLNHPCVGHIRLSGFNSRSQQMQEAIEVVNATSDLLLRN